MFQLVSGRLLALVASAAWIASAGARQDDTFAREADGGQSLILRVEHESAGVVYHALAGRERQITFFSDTPIEDIEGNSNQVIGYAVAGPAEAPAQLVGGEWHLPVVSLRTGIRSRDEHMRQAQWLDAEANPDIIFRLDEVRNLELVKTTVRGINHRATLIGRMTIRGVTNDIEIPGAEIALIAAGSQTRTLAKGDLMRIKAKYEVRLSEYGVTNESITRRNKVSDVISIETVLVLSTVKPEDQDKDESESAAIESEEAETPDDAPATGSAGG